MQNNNNLYFIIEEAYTPSDAPKIIKEEKIGNNKYKLIFRTILQEADVVNNNKRIYPKEVLQEVVNQLSPKAEKRALLGELDHPWVESNDESLIKKRASQVRLSDACVLFRDIKFDGKYVIAECETLTTSKGLDLYALLKDKVNIGFSLRAFGPVKFDTTTGNIVVQKGIKAITYDVVSNPSHSNARILEFLSEDVNLIIPQIENKSSNKIMVLTESLNLSSSLDKDNKQLQEDLIVKSIPLGALVVDLDNDEIYEDPALSNIIQNSYTFKLDTENNLVVICKNDYCISKSIDELLDDIINYYFNNIDDSINISQPIVNQGLSGNYDINSLIPPGFGRRKCGLPPIRYIDPTKCKYYPFIALNVNPYTSLLDNTNSSNIDSNNNNSKDKVCIFDPNSGEEVCVDKKDVKKVLKGNVLDYVSSAASDELAECVNILYSLDESALDNILDIIYKDKSYLEIFEDELDIIQEDLIDSIDDDELLKLAEIEDIKELIEIQEEYNDLVENEIDTDEEYLDINYFDLLEVVLDEIEKDIDEYVNKVSDKEYIKTIINESIEEIIDELNSIPKALYELSIIDDKYEELANSKTLEEELDELSVKVDDLFLENVFEYIISELIEELENDIDCNEIVDNSENIGLEEIEALIYKEVLDLVS